jgi:hypothetical protein
MNRFSTFIILVLLALSCGHEEQPLEDPKVSEQPNIPKLYSRPTPFEKKLKGAVIVASLKGDASVINLFQSTESDKPKVLKVGEIILQGSTITSGKNSEVDLLFTNGTSAKVGSNSKLTISAVWQEGFQESSTKVSDIKEETSPTRIDLDLDIGELIVDVKKLKKESSFRVNSPLGVAGIRGTQFRIFSESKKVELSVLKGAVSFWDLKNGGKEIKNSEKLILETNNEPILKFLNYKEKQVIQKRIISIKKSTETYDLSNLASMLGTKAKPTNGQDHGEKKQLLKKLEEQYSKEKKRLNTEIASLEKDLSKEKLLRKNELDSATQQIAVLDNIVEELERQKQAIQKTHSAEIDNLKEAYNAKLKQLQREISIADATGYKRGIDEMLARQRGQ